MAMSEVGPHENIGAQPLQPGLGPFLPEPTKAGTPPQGKFGYKEGRKKCESSAGYEWADSKNSRGLERKAHRRIKRSAEARARSCVIETVHRQNSPYYLLAFRNHSSCLVLQGFPPPAPNDKQCLHAKQSTSTIKRNLSTRDINANLFDAHPLVGPRLCGLERKVYWKKTHSMEAKVLSCVYAGAAPLALATCVCRHHSHTEQSASTITKVPFQQSTNMQTYPVRISLPTLADSSTI
ncbi:uncharacterized protein BT62DRAFT_1011142 [Guyanagaster necrorhizus]|uniref:Uncharacterized protein n=1 Tax=Guyanagaster necrorhizus TaxID=856835 RepID=A0A9P7VJT3_9AGAR|nr:uncharacterized protein BT62DRAFT_1011142 [Guyanagaster necrorhizus MCA 3950]KAG7441835.1 hypothetical protein BT62DRAFT_1011142 [Guyanagaster necrorhizus MCA 3950]